MAGRTLVRFIVDQFAFHELFYILPCELYIYHLVSVTIEADILSCAQILQSVTFREHIDQPLCVLMSVCIFVQGRIIILKLLLYIYFYALYT